METWVIWLLLAAAAFVFYRHFKGSLTWVGGRSTSKTVGGLGMLVVAALVVGAYATTLPIVGGVIDPLDINFKTQSVGSDSDQNPSVGSKTIETLAWGVREQGTNSQTAFNGAINLYDKNADLGSSTATPIDTITMLNGVGSSTNKRAKTNTEYRVVATNATAASWYDLDYGVIKFPSDELSQNGVFSYYDESKPAQLVATLNDILDENSTTGAMNGQTTHVIGTDEIGCTAGCQADEEFVYDESVGDGQWFIDVTPGASGANAIGKNAVLKFVHDLSNPPEGDEFSSITSSLRTGTDFGIEDDVTLNWKNQIPIELGDVKAGQSATYRFTFNVVEANEDGSDDWTIRFDDLGNHLGKDLRYSVRATADTVTYGGSQA